VTAQRSTRRQRHSYSPEVADLIRERLGADGASLRDICQDRNMPARSTLFVWLRRHPEFAREYTFSKWFQCQWMAEQTVDIADHIPDDCNPENLRRAKRQLAALHSRISKLKPKRYRW
jgi:hypothetical protein